MTPTLPIASVVHERLAQGRRRMFVAMGVWLGAGLTATACLVGIPGEEPRGAMLGLTLAILVAPPVIVVLALVARPSVTDLPLVAAFCDPSRPPRRLTVSYTGTCAHVTVILHDGRRALLRLPEEHGKQFDAWARQQQVPHD